ncbi:helix-turn-helix domain-containing protein [Salmonella enterica]|nr:helix-turn-helix domain-containing protein [Salmonella enterica]
MKDFNGLSLMPRDVIRNSLNIISTAGTLSASGQYNQLADELIDIALQYLNKARVKGDNELHSSDDGNSNIAYRIQLARENLGLSEADLARQIGTYSDHISDWECGITEPPASMVIPLANALKCDPMWLLTGQGNNANQAAPAPVSIMKGADLANIGVRIKNRRNETGMGVDKLADAIDVPIHQIYQWEAGKAIPHSGYYDRLAKALNTSVTWLLTGKITHQDLSGAGKQQHLPASQQADALSHEVPLR